MRSCGIALPLQGTLEILHRAPDQAATSGKRSDIAEATNAPYTGLHRRRDLGFIHHDKLLLATSPTLKLCRNATHSE